MGPWTSLPALLTRTSMPPKRPTAAATMARASASRVTSARAATTRPGAPGQLRREPLEAVRAAGDRQHVGAQPGEVADGVRRRARWRRR